MSLMANIFFFMIISLLMISMPSDAALELQQDFCVGNTAAPMVPAGYSCKNPSSVVSDDFLFKNLFKPTVNFSDINLSLTFAFTPQYPGLNGLGISLLFIKLGVGGIVPTHIHNRANEVIVVTQGTVYVGFIASDNKAYTKTLQVGDTFIFPIGLPHFQVNVGKGIATVLAFFGNSDPGLLILSPALYGNAVPSDVVAKTNFLDVNTVKKLKAMFGGKN